MGQRQMSHDGLYMLDDERFSAAFDPATGALVSLHHKPTGWSIQGRSALAHSFRLVVPRPERLLNVVEGRNQRAPECMMDEGGRQLRFIWNGLESEHGDQLDIRLEAMITLTERGLRFEMAIHNDTPYRIESCAYPYLGDLQKPETADTMESASGFHTDLVRKPLYPRFNNERGYWGTEYPIQMSPTPEHAFLMILAGDQGLYIGCHDTTARERIEYTFRLRPGYGKVGYVPQEDEIAGEPVRIEFYAEHLPFVQPGASYDLLPVMLVPFLGDWHVGADLYADWRETWMERPSGPSWLDEVHAWQQLQMSSWGDSLSIRYDELPDYAEECVEHGVDAIQLTGWTLYGQDGRLPIHDTDPRMGSRDDLKDAIAEMQDRGVRVVLYEKYTCADKITDWYRESLHDAASRDIFGYPHGHGGWRYDTPAHLAGINTRPYAWMCMHSTAWQDVALAEVDKSLELDPDGILLDECQWHGSNAFYCFDETHGHRVPAYNFAGDAVFEKRLREVLEARDGDLVLAGEGPYDLQYRHYTLCYVRAGDGHVPALRYIDPFLPMMNWVHGFDDRESINRCLLYRYLISYEPRHFRGRLSEFPKTLAYGTKVDALRERYRDYLWDAEFCDTVGASVVLEEEEPALYSVFKQGTGKRAVVVVNHGSQDAIAAQVSLDEGAGELVWVTPESPEPVPSEGNVSIPPRSAVVLLER